MTIPDYQSLMLPVLRLAAEGEQRVADVAERITDCLGLTDAKVPERKVVAELKLNPPKEVQAVLHK